MCLQKNGIKKLRNGGAQQDESAVKDDKKEEKAALIKEYGENAKDTGSAEGQIALFTYRINHLTEHLKKNRKDYNTERSLVKLVGKRRALLDYLTKKDIMRYRAIVKELGLRK